jgi:hypothetical protein
MRRTPLHFSPRFISTRFISTMAIIGSALVSGCANSGRGGEGGAVTTTAASDAQRSQLLDRMKSLAGTWEMTGPDGKKQTAAIFSVTSNGSAVREVMFPGADHEMTNMYHMDGPSLVVTHYCAMGNQPRMRATSAGKDTIEFRFDSVTNKTSPDEQYMGQLTIVFLDSNNIQQDWRTLKNGQIDADSHAKFELSRKQ